MKVLVLYNEVQSVSTGEKTDLASAQAVTIAASAVADTLRSEYEVDCVPIAFNLPEVLRRYDPREWVVFNLLEGLGNRADLEPEAAAILERLGYRHTGASSKTLALCLDKARTKTVLESEGIPTPIHAVWNNRGMEVCVPFPAIVKPLAEDASLGITYEGVVTSLGELRKRARYVLHTYREPALVEEFIEGREFNITLLGNDTLECLPLAEIDYSGIADPLRRILSYAAKWETEGEEYRLTPVVCPAPVGSPLDEAIRAVGTAAYKAVECRGYARVDVRVRDEQVYVLEVNPNPDISPEAGVAKAALAAGYSYRDLLERILCLAA